MADSTSIDTPPPDPRPFVISVCGTYLKPEMRSIYRQIIGLTRIRTLVYAQSIENRSLFPFEAVTKMTKLHHRTKGNFLLRFWYKYVIRQWPPPIRINKYVGPCHPYDMPERLRADAPTSFTSTTATKLFASSACSKTGVAPGSSPSMASTLPNSSTNPVTSTSSAKSSPPPNSSSPAANPSSTASTPSAAPPKNFASTAPPSP
jgi:hypothetical protein